MKWFGCNTAVLIDGKSTAAEIRSELKEETSKYIAAGFRPPHLTAILVGDDPASHTYVKNKIQAAREIGITSETKLISDKISEEDLLQIIEQLNRDDNVDGILVQLPLPPHINERTICNAVTHLKDVDGFNVLNIGRMCLDMDAMVPCTPLAVVELIKRWNIPTFGKNIVVVGRSKNVGMPIAMLLHADGRNQSSAMDATVTICHRFTPPKELTKYCALADIIITATGVPGLIKADMVKEGAVVIDVGITRIENDNGPAKLVGDVDFESVRNIAGYITPVPGGVGPMTVAMLMRNTIEAAKNRAKTRRHTNL